MFADDTATISCNVSATSTHALLKITYN